MLLIEFCLTVVAIALALACPNVGSRWFEGLESRFAHLARRRCLAVMTIGITALALRAALLPILPIPEPVVHDEFCYLLAADTFAHGRLTNPAHPMWPHLETFAVIQNPSYQCVAQPAQGAMLAAGRVIGGHPFWGVWFSAGAMCAALCWMLQGWLPPGWALFGGFIAVLRFGTFSYWANSYWGGAMGAVGGALVLGALPRLKRSPRILYAVLMALGLAILANSRPYEGFVFSLPVALALLVWMFGKKRPPLRLLWCRVIAPILLVLTITAAAMSYYCWRVTGNPIEMPYQLERKTYAAAPFFLWQPQAKVPPVYRHEVMQRMYVGEELQYYNLSRTLVGPLVKAFSIWTFYFGPALTLPLLMLLLILPYGFSYRELNARARFLSFCLMFSVIGLGLESFFSPHYASPLACILLAILLAAMRRLRLWEWRGQPSGIFVTRAIVLVGAVMFALRVSAVPLHLTVEPYYEPAWYQRGPDSFGRAALEARLRKLPGQHLVIVRYAPEHEPFAEWVYNDADLDAAKIVWARDMGAVRNEELIEYYKGRHIWLIEPDKNAQSLLPYPSSPVIIPERDEKAQR